MRVLGHSGMGSLANIHTLKNLRAFETQSVHTSNHTLPTLGCKKRTPCLVVAEKNKNSNSGKQQRNNKTTSNSRSSNGFWSILGTRQETPAQSEGNKEKNSNAFWDSFASGNGGDLEEIGPIRIGLTDLLEPDPENMLAVGLIGLLAWATAQICWQLFFVSLAIALAALKYSLIAAILLFILVTLL